MVKALGVTQDDKSVSVDYVDGKIIIEKISHDKGRQIYPLNRQLVP